MLSRPCSQCPQQLPGVWNKFRTTVNPFKHYTGQSRYLDEEDVLYLTTLLKANPSLYLDELQLKLADARDVRISIATLSRALATIQISKKVVTKAALERDEELRTIWELCMAEYTDPSVFVALDESAVDNKTPQRQTGWAPMGQPCVRRMTFLRGVRYSILPALTMDGIIALEIFEGSVTKEKFLSFLRREVVHNFLYHNPPPLEIILYLGTSIKFFSWSTKCSAAR